MNYHHQREIYAAALKQSRRRRNVVTTLKVLLFLTLCWVLWSLVASGGATAWWIAMWGGVVGFVLLTKLDNRIAARLEHQKRLCEICDTEIAYCDGDLTRLDDGARYSDPAHPFSSDLDIFGPDSLFRRLSRSVTASGADTLARWLREPLTDSEQINERLEATAELATRGEWCMDLRASAPALKVGRSDTSFIADWPRRKPLVTARWVVYVANVVTVALWIVAIVGWLPYQWAIWASVGQLVAVGVYTKRITRIGRELEHLIATLDGYLGIVRAVHAAAPFRSSLMQQIHGTLFDPACGDALKSMAYLGRTLDGFDQRNNVFAALILNGLYMRDLHLVANLERWSARYGDQLGKWIDATNRTEALVSMATFRINHPDYAEPRPDSSGPLFDGRALGHPMLRRSECVTNDITVADLHNIYIITGANMAGKSTFLRTVGVNLLLALTGNVVSATELRFRPVGLFTAMRTTDNLSKGESYFHAELLRLQSMVRMAQSSGPLFVILDEMLKGTNSHDKLNGSLRLLERLALLPVSGLVATHDLGLGALADNQPDVFSAACFEIEHTDDRIHYDYTLRAGVSRNMNASILLSQMGLI